MCLEDDQHTVRSKTGICVVVSLDNYVERIQHPAMETVTEIDGGVRRVPGVLAERSYRAT